MPILDPANGSTRQDYPVVISDNFGSATLSMMSDITPKESFDLSFFVLMLTTRPPNTFPWRGFIQEQKLARHFKMTPHLVVPS